MLFCISIPAITLLWLPSEGGGGGGGDGVCEDVGVSGGDYGGAIHSRLTLDRLSWLQASVSFLSFLFGLISFEVINETGD